MAARRVAAVDVLSARRKRQLLVVAALLLAFGGHLLFWYVPRERAAVLDGRSLSGQIFFDSGLANRVWLPYPHQNLARLSHAVEDPSEWALAVVRLLGSSPGFSRLPRFGPFVLPPSRSLTVATDRSGERFVMAAEIYPVIAVVARLAGRLAGNPLLAGGEVTLDGRRFWVSWRDGVWLLCSTDDEIIFTPSSRRLGPILAALEIEAAGGVMPSGRYGLRRQGSDLVLSALERPLPDRSQARRALFESLDSEARRSLAFLGLRDGGGAEESLMVILSDNDGVLRLPSAAVVYLDPDRRWSLPGERWTRWLGLDLRTAVRLPRQVMALDRRSLGVGVQLAEAANAEGGPVGFTTAFWLRPAALLPLVATVRRVLDEIPLFGSAEAQQWLDLETVLAPIVSLPGISLEAGAGGRWVELRFWSERPWLELIEAGGDIGDTDRD